MLSLVYLSEQLNINFNVLLNILTAETNFNSLAQSNNFDFSLKPEYIDANDWFSICKLGNLLEDNSKIKFLSSFLSYESEWKTLKVNKKRCNI
jgi:hypothetical protein